MKKIKLTNCDEYALVDDVDYPRINKERWLKEKVKRSGKIAYRVVCGSIKHDQKHRFSRMSLATFLFDDTNIRPKYADGNSLNNQKANILVNKSRYRGYTGVYKLHTGRYMAKVVGPAGETYYCGTYAKAVEAARAYNKTAKVLFGIDAKLNVFKDKVAQAKAKKKGQLKKGNWAAQPCTVDSMETRYL